MCAGVSAACVSVVMKMRFGSIDANRWLRTCSNSAHLLNRQIIRWHTSQKYWMRTERRCLCATRLRSKRNTSLHSPHLKRGTLPPAEAASYSTADAWMRCSCCGLLRSAIEVRNFGKYLNTAGGISERGGIAHGCTAFL